MAWGDKAVQVKEDDNKEPLAYIDGQTMEFAKTDGYAKQASDALLEKANEIMNDMAWKGLTTKNETKSGVEYTNKAVVSVEKLIVYNKDTGEDEQKTRQDGSDAYSLKIALKSGKSSETLYLYAKDDLSRGIELSNMVIEKWERGDDNKARPKYYRAHEIADAENLSDTTKAIAENLFEMGYVRVAQREVSELKNLAYNLNMMFKAEGDKVPNAEGKLVNNAYARHRKDEYGERVELRSHEDKVMVELGVTSKGDKFIKATNFDFKTEDGKFASLFLNNKADVEEYIANPDIARACIEYRNMDAKEKGNKQKPIER